MKTKACALFMAIIMLFSFVCTAENAYVTIFDPYYTDGTNVYDLKGLSANVSFARAETLSQLILRAVTAQGAVAGGLEIEGETVAMYADGFSYEYTMTLEDLKMLVTEAIDVNQAIPNLLFGAVSGGMQAGSIDKPSLSETVSEIYGAIYGDASQLASAKTATVDTFLHPSMSAFVVPMNVTAQALDEWIAPLASALDENHKLTGLLNTYVPGVPSTDENGEAVIEPMTFTMLYEEVVKPLNLSIKGSAYYGENDIFIEWNLLSGEKTVLPVFLEVTNTENPSLYMNLPLEGGARVVYATIESSEDGMNDYLEAGVLEGERTAALVTYQVYENENMPVCDLYIGLASGSDLYNLSCVSSSDGETERSLHVSAYLDGMEMQISYTGTIAKDYGDTNEQGVLHLATNIGIQASANVGFGSGSGEPMAFIPEGTEAKAIASMTEADSVVMMADFGNLVNTLMTNLMMGVPGLALLIGMENAEG